MRHIMMLLCLANINVVVAGDVQIIGFDDTEVEVREGNRYRFVPVHEIGPPPLDVLDDDGSGFVQVRGRDGRLYWLSRSWIRTNEKTLTPTCVRQAESRSADHAMASVRGLGERCD